MNRIETDWRVEVQKKQRDAALERKRADWLARGNDAAGAVDALRTAKALLDEVQQLLVNHASEPLRAALGHDSTASSMASKAEQLSDEQLEVAKELVETLGARGGILRRLRDFSGALESYNAGANIERSFVPVSTYNRVNAVKLGLIAGRKNLAELDSELKALEGLLDGMLNMTSKVLEPESLTSDSGWAWADLCDCRTLLGDIDGAERAYTAFASKAGSRQPQRALNVLRQVASTLESTGDRAAARITESLSLLERRIGTLG